MIDPKSFPPAAQKKMLAKSQLQLRRLRKSLIAERTGAGPNPKAIAARRRAIRSRIDRVRERIYSLERCLANESE